MAKRQIVDPNDPSGKTVIWEEDGQPADGGAPLPGADAGVPPPPAGVTPPTPPLQPQTPGGPTSIIPMPPPDPFGATLPATMTDPRTAKLNDVVDQFTGKLTAQPDLATAGAQQLAGLREKTAEDRKIGIQDIGRGAAAFGRLGSGVTTSQLGDLEGLLQKRQTAAETGLAGDLARQQGDETRANLSAASGLQGQSYGQNAQQNSEAYDQAMRQRLLEDQLTNSQFNRNATTAELKLRGGTVADNQAAGSTSSASELAKLLAYYRAMSQRPGSDYTAI